MDSQTLLLIMSGLLLVAMAVLLLRLSRRPAGQDAQLAEMRRLQDELAREGERLRASQVEAAESRGRLESLVAARDALEGRCATFEREAAALGERSERQAAGIAERDVRLVEREQALGEAREACQAGLRDLSALRAEHQRLLEAHASLQ